MKKVSVIVPVYNVEQYIAKTIRSVLAQTYSAFELIIVDDESPDRSIEICKQFNDPRVRIIQQKNRGLAGARNTGIRHAQGDYIALLDSDDLWLPTKLEQHVKHLEQSPEVGISFSRSAFIDEADQPLGVYQMPKLKDISGSYLLCRNPIGNGSAPVIRREVLDAIAVSTNLYGTEETFYFDDQFRQSEDIECWIRVVLQTDWKIEGIPDALTLYRVNTESLSANVMKQLASWEQVVEKTRTYAPDVVAQWENTARAYQLRYLARRCVRMQDRTMAVKLFHRSLLTNWKIITEEPRRTMITGAAAYLLWALPKPLYHWSEHLALKVTGASQKRRIQSEQLSGASA
ncbi:glycosyltransferase family 2 protein [Pseudanabaenaceae cyanobacterium LEGE 13415]|nr:glycosyltransferase family 2 protein [Pseudanabaenaceae cyanobacterium LEGE 13415]